MTNINLRELNTWKSPDASTVTKRVPTFEEEWGRVQREGRVPPAHLDSPDKHSLPLPHKNPETTQFHPLASEPLAKFITRPALSWIVKSVIPKNNSLALVYGESGSAKTFFVLDIAFSIARGEQWRGRRVTRVGVVYICAEGRSGLVHRLQAYLKHFGLDSDQIPIEVIASQINLLNPNPPFGEVVDAIRAAEKRMGIDVGLLIIDTLNRTMICGDENSTEDMSLYVRNVSRLAEEIDGCALIVHHSGKDPTRGARGSSSLKAAVDVEIELSRESNERVATITKSRDGEDGARFGFRLLQIDLGVDEDGDAIRSCIVEPVEALPVIKRSAPLPGGTRVALEALTEAIGIHGRLMPETSTIPGSVSAVEIGSWREQFRIRYGQDEKGGDATRKAFIRAKDHLLKLGRIGISDPYVWINR